MSVRSRAEVVAFPGRKAGSQRFSVRDRITISNNTARVRQLGIVRVDLHTNVDHGDPDFGDFLLLYTHGQPWSRWGIGCCGRGFLLWRSATGVSCGYYDTLDEAFDALAPEAARIEPATDRKLRRKPKAIGPLHLLVTSAR